MTKSDQQLEQKLYADRRGFFGVNKPKQSKLHGLFVYPPFSVWNTAEGPWIARRRGWLRLGIKSELGRDLETYHVRNGDLKKSAKGVKVFNAFGPNNNYGGKNKGLADNPINGGLSVFDPVICELVYRWWCKDGGQVVDPFTGGSVRGIVATILNRRYWGCDLNAAQIKANKDQLSICDGYATPDWQTGDALELLSKSPKADLLFSCPPYGNLEQYSDDPRDISSLEYPEFLKAYRKIIELGCSRLRNNRFACFVVGNFRNPETGSMYDLVGDTIRAFQKSGLLLYNEIVLLNSRGTAPFRTNNTFIRGAGKVVKVHQNVLVFVKGDPRKALAQSEPSE